MKFGGTYPSRFTPVMENFSQLLNAFVHRSGISDAELARTLGVSRQTIFRWREGVTGRPRQREDVLRLAQKLRLTPEERDKLLLAAGFRPEITVGRENGEVTEPRGETDEGKTIQSQASPDVTFISPSSSGSIRHHWKLLGVGLGLLLLVIMAAWLVQQGPGDAPATPAPSSPLAVAPPGESLRAPSLAASLTPAQPGETVVLITHFANYASSQVGYNIAGRLAQALQKEIDQAHLEHIRLAIWPQPVGERAEALQAGQAVSATLVIYGEYDVGRIVVEFAQPADQNNFADPAVQRQVADVPDLSATINGDLPQEVRSLALLALGQIYLRQNQADQARPLLIQARDNLKNDGQTSGQTWALANFYVGIAYQHSQPPQLDEAIAAYSQAVEAWPQMISSQLNRSAAYTARQQAGDLELALADANQVITARPEWAVAYNNRGSIRLAMGGAEQLTLALADLEKALSLDAELPEAYVNRAFVRFQQGASIEKAAPDLTEALRLRPDYATALNFFCWGYAVEQQPESALPYCQQAIAADPQPLFFDSRGLTYALLGDYSLAIGDFKVYTAWLEHQSGQAGQVTLAQRRAWIKKLQQGQSPFTPQVLAQLRHELGR